METFLAILSFLGAILSTCTGKPVDPTPSPEPTASPTPTPCPTPTPLPELVIIVPGYIPVGTPFAVSVCDKPFQSGRLVTLDGALLGTLGWNAVSECHSLVSPGLTSPGLRRLSVTGVDGFVDIEVLPKRVLKTK